MRVFSLSVPSYIDAFSDFDGPYIADRWKRVIHFFSDIASRLAPCSDLSFFVNKESNNTICSHSSNAMAE